METDNTESEESSKLSNKSEDSQNKEEVSSDLLLPIWTGSLAWYGAQVPPAENTDITNDEPKILPCTFSTKVVDGRPEISPISVKDWSTKLVMHLLSKNQLRKLEVEQLQNTKNVTFTMGNCPGRPILTRLLRTGRYAGCIHIDAKEEGMSQLKNDMKVIILLFSRKKQATLGFVPNDQTAFITRFLEVIPDHLNLNKNVTSPEQNAQSTRLPENDEKLNHIYSSVIVQSDVVTRPDLESESQEMDTEEIPAVIENNYWDYDLSASCNSKSPLAKASPAEFNSCLKTRKLPNFFKGCKWAPDGSCLLSNSDDDVLRLFNAPENLFSVTDWKNFEESESPCVEMESVLNVKEGGQVYDYCWYPLMSSYDPVSSCFLTTTSDSPVHLWDAFSGKLRASYLAYNQVDEVTCAHSVAFDTSGENIYCGFNSTIRTFNITRPGRQCTVRKLKNNQISDLNQPGIVSCIAVNPAFKDVKAVGSFLKTVGLYHDDGSVLCILQGHLGGVTHLKFSNDGVKLISGGRRDSRLICWDMRFMGEKYQIYDRVVTTNQRIYFDITPNDKYVISGGTDGFVKVWDLNSEATQPWSFQANSDCVNGVSLNPFMPLLATSSGQRHFYKNTNDSSDENNSSDDDEISKFSKQTEEKDVKLWKFSL